MEGSDNNIASSMNMEEVCGNSSASIAEPKMDLGSGCLDRCSNCKAMFSFCKVRISSLIEAKTAEILFPHLPPSDFLCMDCVKMVKSKTKIDHVSKKRMWAGSTPPVNSTPLPSKQDTKKKVTVGSKRNKDSVNITKPCKPNTEGSDNMASNSEQNMEGCDNSIASKSSMNMEGDCVNSLLLTSINLNLKDSANNDMPCTSQESTEVSGSAKAGRHCSLCKRELIPGEKSAVRRTISSMVDLKTAKLLLPHLSPQESICSDPCVKWLFSKTKPIRTSSYKGHKRTWIGFSTGTNPPPPVLLEKESSIQQDSTNTNSVGPSPAPNDDMLSTSEQSEENAPSKEAIMDYNSTNMNTVGPSPAPNDEMPSTSEQSEESSATRRCSHCKKELVPDARHSLPRKRISKLLDKKSAQALFPHLSPEEFICTDSCIKWVYSKTKPSRLPRHKYNPKYRLRTWIGFCTEENPQSTVCRDDSIMDHDSTNTNPVSMPDGPSPAQNDDMPSTSEQSEDNSGPSKEAIMDYNSTNMNTVGPSPAPNDDMPSTSEQSEESSATRRCSHCKKELVPSAHGSLPRKRISKLLDKKSARVLFPHLSPEEFICTDPCSKWVHSKTKPTRWSKLRRTWLGFSVKKKPMTPVPGKEKIMDDDSANMNTVSTSDGPSPAPNDDMPPTSILDKKKKGTVGCGVPALPATPAPTSTQNTEHTVGHIVSPNDIQKKIIIISKKRTWSGSTPPASKKKKILLSVAASKQSKDSVNVTKPCKPNTEGSDNMASIYEQNMEDCDNSMASTSSMKPMPPMPDKETIMDYDSTNMNTVSTSDGPSPVLKDNMPSTSEQGEESSASKRCSNCKKELIRDAHGFLPRIKISSLLGLETAQILFPHLSPEEFICKDLCVKWVCKVACKKKRMDQDSTNVNPDAPSLVASSAPSPASSSPPSLLPKKAPAPPAPKKAPAPDPDPVPNRPGLVSRVIAALRRGRHATALRLFLELPAGPAAFNKVCKDILHKERIKLEKDKEGPFRKQLTRENLSTFSWEETNAWVKEKAPVTLECLRSIFPPAKKISGNVCLIGERRRTLTEEEAQQLLDKRIGMVMSISLFTSSSCEHRFVQSAIGVELWREGCGEKVFKIMTSLGLSQSRQTVKKHIVRLQDGHDKEVKLWKGQVETELRKRTSQVPSFSLIWDRVKILSHAKHDRLGGKKNTMWAFRFAHRNRIQLRHQKRAQKKAVEVSPDSILPSKQTYEGLRQRMKTIVMRIIVDNLTALEGLRSKVVWHIPHLYSKQMKEKSDLVNLGAVPVDSSTTEGDNEIMASLIEYVPTPFKKPHQVLCCSDGLNVDTKLLPSESTCWLVDAPPEYHKESLCYQDIAKMLCSEKSLEARGSLSQLKSVFARRGHCIEGKVKETLQYVWDLDFITFVTTAYITLYAATECNLDTVDQQPSDFPTDAEAQMEWLSGLSHRLVDLVWMPPPQEDINTAAATASLSEVQKNESCFCGKEKPGEPLVRCCSNLCGGVWFHEGCASMDTMIDPSVTQDWFCSSECQGDGTYIYCYCKEQRGGQMVQCALMDKCRRHEWYHKDCLSLSEQENAVSEESPWYCSEKCFFDSDADDHVLNYTKALVWEGLYNMARRDAIREGDGEAITDFWKMDMVLFWARKHLKDFTTCHLLLTGIEGFYPEHIRDDLKWNRVANLEGKPGGNISLDLVNELMNVEFKESLARVSYHYTNEMMKGCGMMAGTLGSEADRLLITGLAGNSSSLTTSLPSSHSYKRRRQSDIAKFVAEYKKDHLFSYIPGRAHQGFENFAYQQKIQTPEEMGKTMRNLAQDMDQRSREKEQRFREIQ